MKAIISIGISGSGKSTEFNKKEYKDYVRIERDIMRKDISRFDDVTDTVNFWSTWKFTKEKENEVTKMCNDMIEYRAKQNENIIISDTNLNKGRREELQRKLEALGYEVELKIFDIDVMDAIKRDEKRRDTVGHQTIWKQYEQFTAEFPKKQYVPDVTKPKCILVDIDGTLAHMNGKRGPFDWDKVGVDDVDEMVRTVVKQYFHDEDTGHVIILSGRDGICRPQTEQWLFDNSVPYDKLIMRAPDDQRKDTIVKEEIFWRDIADNYNVQFVIDDRPAVIRMWQSLGLKTFIVGNPWIEF